MFRTPSLRFVRRLSVTSAWAPPSLSAGLLGGRRPAAAGAGYAPAAASPPRHAAAAAAAARGGGRARVNMRSAASTPPPPPSPPPVPSACFSVAPDGSVTFDAAAAGVILEGRPAAASTVRTLVLNRPGVLNSLNSAMVTALRSRLLAYEAATPPGVGVVFLRGTGRAYCAGGDLRALYAAGAKSGSGGGDPAARLAAAEAFFRAEYKLNYVLGTLGGGVIAVALLDGIVMGGGVGVSVHAPFRVATERVVLAMPEAVIGLHPDVGASHLLGRLPGRTGEWMAATGARLTGAQAVAVGLATHLVPSGRLADLVGRLEAVSPTRRAAVEAELAVFAEANAPGRGGADADAQRRAAFPHADAMDEAFGADTLEETVATLEGWAAGAGGGNGHTDDVAGSRAAWAAETLGQLAAGSPFSVKLGVASVRAGRTQSLRSCLVREHAMSVRCAAGADVWEGIRAALVDKDRSPRWAAVRLADVADADVAAFMRPLTAAEDGVSPLELEPRGVDVYMDGEGAAGRSRL